MRRTSKLYRILVVLVLVLFKRTTNKKTKQKITKQNAESLDDTMLVQEATLGLSTVYLFYLCVK